MHRQWKKKNRCRRQHGAVRSTLCSSAMSVGSDASVATSLHVGPTDVVRDLIIIIMDAPANGVDLHACVSSNVAVYLPTPPSTAQHSAYIIVLEHRKKRAAHE